MKATWMELMESKIRTAHAAPLRGPAAFEESVRKAEELVAHAQHVGHDALAQTVGEVQHHPLRAVTAFALGGAALGCFVGFILGWQTFASTLQHERERRCRAL